MMFDATIVHEFWSLWFNYFWPSLKGNGPEALVQTVAYAAVGVVLLPVFRKVLREEAERAHKIASGEVVDLEADLRKLDAVPKRLWQWVRHRKTTTTTTVTTTTKVDCEPQ
jgi:hypothetical protein